MTKQARADVIALLAKRFTEPAMVAFGTPQDTLIATLLSARTRDEQVMKVYPTLKARFPTFHDLAAANVEAIRECIKSVGLSPSKARALKLLGQQIIERHQGEVPRTMEELVELAGVGRKTASCVLWYAFGLPAIAVDTHVLRITKRLGWVKGTSPVHVEQELKRALPREAWGEMNRVFVPFGRAFCRSQKPLCATCPLLSICPTGLKPLSLRRRGAGVR